jgi:signal transduction histidine kinase
VAAVLFPILKKFFDRLTNRLFYRDAYDPQELLNTLNKVLVSTTNLSRLSDGITATLKASFKADYCAVILIDPKTSLVSHVVGAAEQKFSAADMKAIHSRALLTERHPLVISADDLDYSESSLKRVLVKDDIAVLAQIGRKTPGGSEGLGHLLFGPKRSGNPYSSQDLRIIETIANELVIAFQNALRFEEIENFNATLQQKVDDATRKLRRTNEKLRQLDETKDDFISMASHQLRTPLTSVKGYVSMVIDGDAGELNQMQRKLLTQAFISSQRMVYLISDLLNVSRLRTGKFVIETVPVNLANIVQEEVKQLIETAKGRNLELIYHKPDHFPLFQLDETKMRQVIMNFIDNAIYYTPSGGKIVVTLVERPQAIEFTVADNGIGVPKPEQHHLFSKFYRADNAKRARPDGTGLGLFMAKKVIMSQGGSIVFKSQEGIGSTFGFTFAKSQAKGPVSTEK